MNNTELVKEYDDMGNKIKKYFQDLKNIEVLEYQKQMLIKENKELNKKSVGVDMKFRININAIDYSKQRLAGGEMKSDFDNQIDNFYNSLSNRIIQNEMKILSIEDELLKLTEKNRHLQLAISILKEEPKKILVMRYRYNCSQEQIGFECNTSRATVQRVIEQTKKDLEQYLKYYGF